MTFYEQELRKIIGEQYPDATYVGRVCYVRLSDMNRAKIQFVTGSVANQYNALQLTILNRSEGQVDTLRLRFSDLLGTKVTSNPNFRNGVDPHIWDDYGKVDWYVYHPTRQDYEKLSNAVSHQRYGHDEGCHGEECDCPFQTDAAWGSGSVFDAVRQRHGLPWLSHSAVLRPNRRGKASDDHESQYDPFYDDAQRCRRPCALCLSLIHI